VYCVSLSLVNCALFVLGVVCFSCDNFVIELRTYMHF